MPDAGDGDDFPPVDIAVARDAVDRWHDEDEELEQLQDAVREIVENMNEPCRSILWAYYWDGKNTRTIADEQHYSNARVAITQLSRCRTKVREAMTDIINKLRQ